MYKIFIKPILAATVISLLIAPTFNTQIASAGEIVQQQNPSTANKPFTLGGHTYDIEAIAFSSDGQTLVSASLYNKVHVWNTKTRKLVRTINLGKDKGAVSLAIAPDGKVVYTGGEKIQAWSLSTGKLLRTLDPNAKNVNALSITPDGQILASSSFDKTIKLWNLQTGKLIRNLKGHSSIITGLAISPDGKTLASTAATQYTSEPYKEDKTISLWNIKTGKLLQTLSDREVFHSFLAFSPDGKMLLSSRGKMGAYGQSAIWNLSTGKIVTTIPSSAVFLSLSRDAKTLLSVDVGHEIALWDAVKGTKLKTIVEADKFEDDRNYGRVYANTATLSPDGKTLAVGDGGVLSGFGINVQQISF